MVAFGHPKPGSRLDRRGDGPRKATAFNQGAPRFFGCSELVRLMIEDHASILRSDVRSLPIDLSWIVIVPENCQELLVGDNLRVILNLHGLCMPRLIRAHIFVGGILLPAAGISHSRPTHARRLPERLLNPPKTARPKCCQRHVCHLHRFAIINNAGLIDIVP